MERRNLIQRFEAEQAEFPSLWERTQKEKWNLQHDQYNPELNLGTINSQENDPAANSDYKGRKLI